MREKTMKKLLGVSIAAMLAVSPMMANAALGTVGDSKATYSDGQNAKPTLEASAGIASVTYVKGAYDALAEKHNALDTRVGTLEGDVSTPGSVLKGIKDEAEKATYTPDANTKNLTGVSDINTAIDTLDADMGATATLNKTATNADRASGSVLYGHNGTLVQAVQKVADALDASNTDSSITEEHFIGKNSNHSTTVSGALNALDTAAYQNKGAIDTLADKRIAVYTTWGAGTVSYDTSLGSLMNGQTGASSTPVASATVPDTNEVYAQTHPNG